MQSLTFEHVFPIAQKLARQKARKAVGCCGLVPADRDDIESELLLKFWLRFPKFNAQRASLRTFASRVMDKELFSILRRRLASRRQCLLESVLSGEIDQIVDPTLSPIEREQFWSDVARALASLPAVADEVAEGLCWESPSELGRSLRCRSRIYHWIGQLRSAFLAAGIGPDYFTNGARR